MKLPYLRTKEQFDKAIAELLQTLLESGHDQSCKYLKSYSDFKHKWNDAYRPIIFSAGTHTTSRAESVNSAIKRYVNSQSELCALLILIEDFEKGYAFSNTEKESKKGSVIEDQCKKEPMLQSIRDNLSSSDGMHSCAHLHFLHSCAFVVHLFAQLCICCAPFYTAVHLLCTFLHSCAFVVHFFAQLCICCALFAQLCICCALFAQLCTCCALVVHFFAQLCICCALVVHFFAQLCICCALFAQLCTCCALVVHFFAQLCICCALFAQLCICCAPFYTAVHLLCTFLHSCAFVVHLLCNFLHSCAFVVHFLHSCAFVVRFFAKLCT